MPHFAAASLRHAAEAISLLSCFSLRYAAAADAFAALLAYACYYFRHAIRATLDIFHTGAAKAFAARLALITLRYAP